MLCNGGNFLTIYSILDPYNLLTKKPAAFPYGSQQRSTDPIYRALAIKLDYNLCTDGTKRMVLPSLS